MIGSTSVKFTINPHGRSRVACMGCVPRLTDVSVAIIRQQHLTGENQTAIRAGELKNKELPSGTSSRKSRWRSCLE